MQWKSHISTQAHIHRYLCSSHILFLVKAKSFPFYFDGNFSHLPLSHLPVSTNVALVWDRWCLNYQTSISFKKSGASLMAQWLRIRLPMQGTRVWALVREDPTCRRATKPMRHNYWACALEPTSHNYWAHVPQLLKPARLEPVLRNKRSHCNEKPAHRNKE